MMKSKKRKVKTIEETKSGEIIINLASTAANDDWIRAARLLKTGRKKELGKMHKQQMYNFKGDEEN
jgi:hypothetical protein